jgi:50S ribosomal protein L16 3-hydroxylase
MSAKEFLDRHWQKAPLYMPQALPGGLPELSVEELGWLATLDDVESRIVLSEQGNGTTHYRVEHGPFNEEFLAALPPENWTLLVQDVEKHLPVFRHMLRQASFIPDWRIDDLMVSFAAPGGSVGPHLDNYDVFLCQGIGRREWRIAPQDADLKKIQSDGVSLLEAFTDDSPVEASQCDVLYLPPGIAHWGIASEACMTYSIGMRAPTLSEFLAGVSRIHDTEVDHDKIADLFYVDPDLALSEAEPGLISEQALRRARSAFSSTTKLDDKDFAYVFGSVVTDVKAWLAPEVPTEDEVDSVLESLAKVSEPGIHGMARLAFCYSGAQGFVFVNGFGRKVSDSQIHVFRQICANRTAAEPEINELFAWLAAKGAFDLASDQPNDET